MDFQKRLLEIGKALSTDEVKALAFLCTDLLGRNPASVESASDLFSRLVHQDHLSAGEPQLLAELLSIIQRKRLVRDLELNGQSNLITSYRKLLYNLSEEITDDDLKDMKFLLNKRLPRRKLEDNVTTLDVFLEMEHMDLISNTNLDLLEAIIKSVCPMLKDRITHFKAQQAAVLHTSLVAQETCQPQSSSYSFEPTQVLQSHERTSSSAPPEPQLLAEPTMNSSNTSMDFPYMFHPGQESEALSQGLSVLSTETSSLRSDALVMHPQKNKTSSENQLSQTTNTNSEVLGTYPMTANKRGICLIINNYDFTKSGIGLLKREGTMIDEKCLQRVFEWLGFQIEIERDCPSKRMLSVVKKLGSRNHSQMDCLVCCVLSHGSEGSVYGVDGCTISIRDLMEPFTGLSCRSLVGKPKLFFIQACQGTSEQKPVYIEADSRTRSHVCSDAIEVRESIPSDADFLLGMATIPSFVSYRERKNGTWFIQSLCQNLVRLVPRHDLVSILTKVNADVSQKTDTTGVKKQMPQPAFTLTKKVVFPIPQDPAPTL